MLVRDLQDPEMNKRQEEIISSILTETADSLESLAAIYREIAKSELIVDPGVHHPSREDALRLIRDLTHHWV